VDPLVLLAIVAILAAVAWAIGGPLRAGAREEDERADAVAREELEAAREAKYREIRDAELDHRTGKLDDADWRAIDRQLRAEAVEILRALDALDR
jgi:hypothetical protein